MSEKQVFPTPSTLTFGNFFAALPQSLPEELTDQLLVSKNVRIERIISTGQVSPPQFWYDQAECEWVIVLQGEAELEFAGQTERKHLKPGDYVFVPAHQKHRVTWTSTNMPTVWLAVFFTYCPGNEFCLENQSKNCFFSAKYTY